MTGYIGIRQVTDLIGNQKVTRYIEKQKDDWLHRELKKETRYIQNQTCNQVQRIPDW